MEGIFDTYAYFWVSDFDCDPMEITEAIGLEPTDVLLKGGALENGRISKRSIWKFHSSLPRTEIYQDAHLSNLMSNLLSRLQQIKAIGKRYPMGISCVGYYTNAHPGFHMSAELIQQCATLGLSIDFDLYNFCEPQENA